MGIGGGAGDASSSVEPLAPRLASIAASISIDFSRSPVRQRRPRSDSVVEAASDDERGQLAGLAKITEAAVTVIVDVWLRGREPAYQSRPSRTVQSKWFVFDFRQFPLALRLSGSVFLAKISCLTSVRTVDKSSAAGLSGSGRKKERRGGLLRV